MPEHSLAKLIQVWCANGRRATPESAGLVRAIGWTDDYFRAGGRNPEGEVIQQLFAELTAFSVEVTRKSIMLWDSEVPYDHPALCRGSDGAIYDSVQDSLNQDPTTDASNTYWNLLIEAPEIPDASSSKAGLVELATTAEVDSDDSYPLQVPTVNSLRNSDYKRIRKVTQAAYNALSTQNKNHPNIVWLVAG